MVKKKVLDTQNSNTSLSKKELYVNAFKELKPELEEVRIEIFSMLNTFLKKYYDSESNEHDVEFVLFEPTSRTKGETSFEEKLVRKSYVKTWTLEKDSNNQNDYKQTILKNLDDIIGFRINCYFKKDENNIYADVIDYFEKNDIYIKEYGTENNKKIIDRSIIPDFIKKQANGEPIYKMVCLYKSEKHQNNIYPFELQIKSLVHNLWGEVDHEIAYKAKLYDYDYDKKTEITKAIFESLKASDTQLLNLYKNSYDEMSMINSLFFLYSHQTVQRNLNGKNPTFYYHKFFKLFCDSMTSNAIKEFVGKSILHDSSFKKKEVQFPSTENKLQNKFLSILNEYNFFDIDRLSEVKEISEIIYDWKSDSSLFYKHIFSLLESLIEKNGIISENPDLSLDDEEDDDTVLLNDLSEPETEPKSLDEILNKELKKIKKRKIFENIDSLSNFNNYEKEILCRIFFYLIDNL